MPINEIDEGLPEPEQSPEQEQMYLDKIRDAQRAQLRSVVLSEGDRTALAEERLHSVLGNLLYRPESDPEMVDLVNSFLGELNNISSHGDRTGPMPTSARQDIKSVLIGARMALQMRRDRTTMADKQPKSQLEHARHFLDLVKSRVGYVDQNSGDTHIRMNVYDDQASDKLTYRKTK